MLGMDQAHLRCLEGWGRGDLQGSLPQGQKLQGQQTSGNSSVFWVEGMVKEWGYPIVSSQDPFPQGLITPCPLFKEEEFEKGQSEWEGC